jgi:hypothetical protein
MIDSNGDSKEPTSQHPSSGNSNILSKGSDLNKTDLP